MTASNETSPKISRNERALLDLRDTLASLAIGLRPKTVMGGLIANGPGRVFSSTLVTGRGRSGEEIAAKANIDPVDPDNHGYTIYDILAEYVELGLVEVPEDPDGEKRTAYRISEEDLPDDITRCVLRLSDRTG